MAKLLDEWRRHPSLLNEEGGGCARVSRPGIKEPGAPKCPTQSRHDTNQPLLIDGRRFTRLDDCRAAKPDRCFSATAKQ